MTDIETLSIDLADLLSGLDSNGSDGQSILVAGQALSFWGHYYLSSSMDLSALSSRDIDFYNKRTQQIQNYVGRVREYLQTQGLELREQYPDLLDHQFATALWEISGDITVSSGQKQNVLIVDFLNFVGGLSDEDLEGNSEEVKLDDKTFRVLSPILCLKARVHNLLNLYPGKKSPEKIQNEEDRVRLAIEIVRLHIEELFYWQHDGEKMASKRSKKVLKIAQSQLGRKLYREKQISILDAIPKSIFDDRFYSIQCTNAAKRIGIPDYN